MILLLNTSTGIVKLTLIDGDWRHDFQQELDRQMARFLLKFLRDSLAKQQKELKDIAAIGVFKGPGSFTSLRIGLTVANTLAQSLNVPIVGETGEDWQNKALHRLENKQNDQIVLPEYGAAPRITAPKK